MTKEYLDFDKGTSNDFDKGTSYTTLTKEHLDFEIDFTLKL